MRNLLSFSYVHANKSHSCHWCMRVIPKGSIYIRAVFLIDGESRQYLFDSMSCVNAFDFASTAMEAVSMPKFELVDCRGI